MTPRTKLAALAAIGVVSSVAWLALGPSSAPKVPSEVASIGEMHGGMVQAAAGAGRYPLEKLDVLGAAFDLIDTTYVDPQRVDWDRVLDASLEAVERKVPEALFTRSADGKLLYVQVGAQRTGLEIDRPTTHEAAERVLRQVAALLADHLDPSSVETDDTREPRPYAEVEYALVNGALSTLDPHSHLYPPEDSREMDVENQGHFGGLGLSARVVEGRLTVEYPVKNTPAMRAGLQTDDVIVRIDGESTRNMGLDEGIRRLRGPVGSSVLLELERPGTLEAFELVLERERIPLNPVEATLLDGKIAYVSISNFHLLVETELKEELHRLKRESGGLEGVILDLRGNPGGYLDQAERVSDLFLSSGMLVSTVDRNLQYKPGLRTSAAGTEPNYPMAVLMNARSASASEIVAGALRGNERAVIIGERSFGKGSVQSLVDLADESKLKLTTAVYLTPGDQSIQAVGIPADIALTPAVISSRTIEGEEVPWAALHHRERVRREGDLDKSLDQQDFHLQEPSYVARFLSEPSGRKRRTTEIDVSGDLEVSFARELLVAAPSARRAEILASAEPVVKRYTKLWDAELVAAFDKVGVDWTDGAVPASPALEVVVSVSDDGVLDAGVPESWSVAVTNRGTETVHRLVGVSTSEVDALSGREFVLGAIAPGQTRTWTQHVTLVDGYPTERVPVSIALRSGEHAPLHEHAAVLATKGRALPAFAWRWDVKDADGDGVVSLGEDVSLALTVTNVGEGPSREAWARVENRSGAALDLGVATLEPGHWRTPDGEACSAEAAATDKSCLRSLAAGESWTGEFTLTAREDVPLVMLRARLGDESAYDHAATMRGGFYRYTHQRDTVAIAVGEPLKPLAARRPPTIEVAVRPPAFTATASATLSGMVSDDEGLSHVMIYHGDDKVFQQSGQGGSLASLPFTVDLTLTPGPNTVSILSTDATGATRAQSVVTWFEPAEQQAAAGEEL